MISIENVLNKFKIIYMRNLIVILFILLFSISELFAKEVRTRYGFYIDLPNNYISSTANMDDLLKESGDDVPINKDYFNEMLAGSSKSDMNVEYFFPKKKYNPEFNNINITMMDGNVREFLEFTKKEICSEIKVMVSGLYKKNVREYGCEINPKKIKKKLVQLFFILFMMDHLKIQKFTWQCFKINLIK